MYLSVEVEVKWQGRIGGKRINFGENVEVSKIELQHAPKRK